MALNFPDTPTIGSIYSVAGYTWEWDGVKWNSISDSLNLDNLSGVEFTYPLQVNQGLFYNGTHWVNTTHTHNINELTGTLISDPTTGQVLSYNGIYWTNMAPADAGFNPFLLMGA